MQPPTDKNATDYIHAAVKAAASAVPFAGGPLAVLFDSVFSAPLEKRKEAWLEQMGFAISELCAKLDGMTPEKLSENEAFISTCLHASQIALRSHQQEKIIALRAAIMNSVLLVTLDEAKMGMFIRLVDDFSPLHLKILDMYGNAESHVAFLQKRNARVLTHYPNLASVWDEIYQDIPSQDPLVKLAEQDIRTRGLSYAESLHTAVQHGSKLNPLGKEFLKFITDQS